MAFTVTKDTIIGDIMDADENTAPYFMEMGMHCLFCPASRGGKPRQFYHSGTVYRRAYRKDLG